MPWHLSIPLASWLFAGFVATFIASLALSLFVMIDRARYERRRQVLAAIMERMADGGADSAPLLATRPAVTRILDRLPRRAVDRLIADVDTPAAVATTYAAYSVRRWGLASMVRDASSHRRRAKWRRIAALFALERIRADGVHPLLEQALADRDPDIAGAAVIVLHRLGDRRAAEILVAALRARSYPPSRIATQLDQFPISVDDVLRPLLSDALAHARYWGASLLRRYTTTPGLAGALAALTEDPDAPIRKVALESLADVDRVAAVPVATARLDDPVDFVRSAAVRSLTRIAVADPGPDARGACARAIVPLLADPTFDVRLATKEALVALGSSVWAEVAAALDSTDRFARNGSAEVLQNLGLIDAVVEGIARGGAPSPEMVRVLGRVFEEGGPGMVDAAVARSRPQLVSSAPDLFAHLGIAT